MIVTNQDSNQIKMSDADIEIALTALRASIQSNYRLTTSLLDKLSVDALLKLEVYLDMLRMECKGHIIRKVQEK